MVNINKLKGSVIERELNIKRLSEKTGIDRARLYRRFKDPSQFTIAEVDSIVEVLGLSAEEALDIFFACTVA